MTAAAKNVSEIQTQNLLFFLVFYEKSETFLQVE